MKRTRLVSSTAVLALVLAAFWMRRAPSEARPTAAEAVEEAEEAQVAIARTTDAKTNEVEAEVVPTKAPVPPVIDDVSVEKREVCEGEDNLVTVRAHAADGDDGGLRYVVGTGRGPRVPLRVFRAEANASFEVQVFGADGAVANAKVPPFRVKRCEGQTLATIAWHVLENTTDLYELRVETQGGGRVRRVKWSFGDGSQDETSTSATVVHDYGDRPQESLYGYVLVKADVELEDGRTATARQSLELPNLAAVAKRRGVTLVSAGLEPRFPTIDEHGIVEQTVRLRHLEKSAVLLDDVVVTSSYDDSNDESEATVNAASVLGVREIPPGRGVVVQMRLDTRASPGLVTRTFRLRGRTASGSPASGAFSIMKPAPLPTADNSVPVEAAGLVARILRARQTLGKQYVTRTDLDRLERSGAFADLEPWDEAWER